MIGQSFACVDSLIHPTIFAFNMTAKNQFAFAGNVLFSAVDIVTAAAAKYFAIFATKTLSIHRSRP